MWSEHAETNPPMNTQTNGPRVPNAGVFQRQQSYTSERRRELESETTDCPPHLRGVSGGALNIKKNVGKKCVYAGVWSLTTCRPICNVMPTEVQAHVTVPPPCRANACLRQRGGRSEYFGAADCAMMCFCRKPRNPGFDTRPAGRKTPQWSKRVTPDTLLISKPAQTSRSI